MNANGQPFNMLKNPLSAFLTRVVGKGKQINTHPIHDASGEFPNPVGVSTGFKGFWGFNGTTDEMQHLAGLGVLVSDQPKGFPLLGYGGVGHFSQERWIWAEGDDGSAKLAELESTSIKYFAWNGDYLNPRVLEEMDKESYEALLEEAEEYGGLKSEGWAQEFEERFGEPGRLIAWRTKKNLFRHMCDRLLIAQNCHIEGLLGEEDHVMLEHGAHLHWHAPQGSSLSPFHGKVRGWTGPACDIQMPWKSRAEEKAKEDEERYDEDESDSESDSDSGDMGTIQFHTRRYLDFIPMAIHQHATSHAHANPGKRQAYADEIVEEYQVGLRNKLPRAWGVPENTPICKIQFKTPREQRTDGKKGRFIEEDIDDAIDAVDAGTGIQIIYWDKVPADANTTEAANKIFGECRLGYYWKLVDADGWEDDGDEWLYKDFDEDGTYDRRKPKGEWVPYENAVNKLFYCGPTPLQWDSSWGGKIEEGGKKIWNPDGNAFVHGAREGDDYSGTVDDGLTAQEKLCIPLDSAFDLMVIVEVWKFRQYIIFDQSKPFPKPGNDEDPMYTLNAIPNSYRKLGLQARIVKPISPQETRSE